MKSLIFAVYASANKINESFMRAADVISGNQNPPYLPNGGFFRILQSN